MTDRFLEGADKLMWNLWSFGLIHKIDHAKLLAKLSSLGASVSAVEWFKSYMHDRQQYVRIGSETSGMRKLHTEFHRVLFWDRPYLMCTSTICLSSQFIAPWNPT